MPKNNLPCRGELWDVSFDPTLGAEIRKTRPTLVISSDFVGRLPIKLVAPLTDWKPNFATDVWHVRVDPSPENGLTKSSAVGVLQIRGLDVQRFVRLRGAISPEKMEEVTLAIQEVIEAE